MNISIVIGICGLTENIGIGTKLVAVQLSNLAITLRLCHYITIAAVAAVTEASPPLLEGLRLAPRTGDNL